MWIEYLGPIPLEFGPHRVSNTLGMVPVEDCGGQRVFAMDNKQPCERCQYSAHGVHDLLGKALIVSM